MPADHPLPGEVWSLPNQASLTTSGEGGQAVVVDVRDEVVTLYGVVRPRRLVVPLRSFLLMWNFVREARAPEQCSETPCANPAWFGRRWHSVEVFPVCWAHLSPDAAPPAIILPADLSPALNLVTGRCPACDAPSRFPGSGVRNVDRFVSEIEVHSCGKCRRDWVFLYPEDTSPESCVTLAEHIRDTASALETAGFVTRVRLGTGALEMVRRAVGSLGEPPTLAGVPLTVSELPRGPLAVYAIGYQPREVQRGVQRLGGQPDRTDSFTAANLQEVPPPSIEKPYTNVGTTPRTPPKDLSVGAAWWHKNTFEQVYILEIGSKKAEVFIKFRTQGAPDVLVLDDFLAKYQEKPPTPPASVGEEWEDTQGNSVHVKTLDDAAAVVVDGQGRTYLLPYVQFHHWRKIERRSVYERIIDDPDETV